MIKKDTEVPKEGWSLEEFYTLVKTNQIMEMVNWISLGVQIYLERS